MSIWRRICIMHVYVHSLHGQNKEKSSVHTSHRRKRWGAGGHHTRQRLRRLALRRRLPILKEEQCGHLPLFEMFPPHAPETLREVVTQTSYNWCMTSMRTFLPQPPPPPRVDDTFGGKLFSRYQGSTKEEKTPALPLSGVIANAARHVTGVVAGVSRSPLAEEGRAREDAQRWGTHVSLSSPAIRQFKPDYYRVHYPDDIPEDEQIYPHSNWSTASAAQISKKGYPADFRVKAVQMRDWEAMSRASLGILNHLDWFMSSVWTVLDGCPIEKDQQADIDKLMSASGIAVNQLAHIQMRSLASNATVRREAILESSVLDRQGALFLRSQPIGDEAARFNIKIFGFLETVLDKTSLKTQQRSPMI